MTLLYQKNKQKNSGFTLIELIVTVSIAAILTSIAVPNFSAMMKSNRVTTATNEFVSALLLARSEALKRSNTVTVCISDDQETCKGEDEIAFEDGWLVFLDCDADGVLDSAANSVDCDNDGQDDTDQLINIHEGIVGINLSAKGAGVNVKKGNVLYSFSGRSNPRSFFVRPENTTQDLKQVRINRTGRVSVVTCITSGTEPNPCDASL